MKSPRNAIFYLELVHHTHVIDEDPRVLPDAVVTARDEAAALAAVPAVEQPYEWTIKRVGKADRGVAAGHVLRRLGFPFHNVLPITVPHHLAVGSHERA